MHKIIGNDVSEAVYAIKNDPATRTAVKVAMLILCDRIITKLNFDREQPKISADVVDEVCENLLIDLLEGRV